MDNASISEALERARIIISSHGMMAHMPSYYRSILAQSVGSLHGTTCLQYEFLLDPKKSSYNDENHSCVLIVRYDGDNTVERDGGVYRDLVLKVSIRNASSIVTTASAPARENMLNSMLMLCEMIESALPSELTLTVKSPEVLTEERKVAHEQLVSSRIEYAVGKESLKNLRVGGRPRVVRIPDSYAEMHGSMPEPGRYRYDQVRRSDRRGRVKDRAEFLFVVSTTLDGATLLKAFRTS